MKALFCPKCGGPLREQVPSCPYCGAGLVGDDASVQQNGPTPRALAQVQIPDGWQEYRDPWLVFSIAHPREWAGVLYDKKTIYINMGPSGFSRAILWSYNLRVQANAFNVATQVIGALHTQNPTFQAWCQDNVAPNSIRLTLRSRQIRAGQALTGSLNILVDGQRALVSGFEAPKQPCPSRRPSWPRCSRPSAASMRPTPTPGAPCWKWALPITPLRRSWMH